MVADITDKAASLLRSAGLRVTQPRIAVLTHVLEAGEAHLSADELLEKVSAGAAAAHRATVYRTLEGLTEAGVLSHVHLDRGITAYHLAPGITHLHAQCEVCGRVVDLPADLFGDTADRIRRAVGFELEPAHVALSGRCKQCARSKKH